MGIYTDLVKELLDACKGQHEAIDRLFAELIMRDEKFFPSKSGRPWEAVQKGNEVIHKAEGALQELGDAYLIKMNALEFGVLFGLIMLAPDHSRKHLDNVWKQLVVLKKQAEEKAGVTKEIIPGGMIKSLDKDGNVIIRQPYPYETEGN